MGKSTQPLLKRCKALGINPIVMGYGKVSKRNQKETRRKISEYGLQLKEKQKVKFIYGIMEKQFHRYYVMATKKHGVAGEMLLQLLESRIDNVIFRMGFSKTRDEARQMVSHGHILVNGKKVDIPSYLVKVGDVISIKEKSKSLSGIKLILAKNGDRAVPGWLEVDRDNYTGKVVALATKADIDYSVQENLIVEFYSR
ncbi:MAG: 30S ribosomal protein S4 [Spirochaetaceae bacterium]|nr:30S ribosomal protein S4 [Spirochaetaceae bacterium]MBP5441628.1 30S ribosomal protein S4 [Treponema sp.]MBO4729797.1 30S ribosomal protein S4 [Spirochaetaceae bacterium]MBO7136073.1 30S ribosomal protein S4 [Spirochaetaceae bacterium]MBP5601129.1 30S ribosomal protein S4 [Treponema sp.]